MFIDRIYAVCLSTQPQSLLFLVYDLQPKGTTGFKITVLCRFVSHTLHIRLCPIRSCMQHRAVHEQKVRPNTSSDVITETERSSVPKTALSFSATFRWELPLTIFRFWQRQCGEALLDGLRRYRNSASPQVCRPCSLTATPCADLSKIDNISFRSFQHHDF